MPEEQIAYFGFTGMIEPGGVGRIAGALNSAVNSGVGAVHMSFSSNGGYVADGIYLHNHMRALPLHVTIYNTGSVGSIAVSVFLAAAERYCSQHSMFMIHPTTMSAESMSARRLNQRWMRPWPTMIALTISCVSTRPSRKMFWRRAVTAISTSRRARLSSSGLVQGARVFVPTGAEYHSDLSSTHAPFYDLQASPAASFRRRPGSSSRQQRCLTSSC